MRTIGRIHTKTLGRYRKKFLGGGTIVSKAQRIVRRRSQMPGVEEIHVPPSVINKG